MAGEAAATRGRAQLVFFWPLSLSLAQNAHWHWPFAGPANFKGKRVKNSYELRAEMEWPGMVFGPPFGRVDRWMGWDGMAWDRSQPTSLKDVAACAAH